MGWSAGNCIYHFQGITPGIHAQVKMVGFNVAGLFSGWLFYFVFFKTLLLPSRDYGKRINTTTICRFARHKRFSRTKVLQG